MALGSKREGQAGKYALAVNVDGAGPALTVITTLLSSGEVYGFP
jgi:hypothetical protein